MKLRIRWFDHNGWFPDTPLHYWIEEWHAEAIPENLELAEVPRVYEHGRRAYTMEESNQELWDELQTLVQSGFRSGEHSVLETSGLTDDVEHTGTIRWDLVPDSRLEREWLREETTSHNWLPRWDDCFDPEKIMPFQDGAEEVYEEIEKVAQRPVSDWPRLIECMTPEEVAQGEAVGAGHGLYIRKWTPRPGRAPVGVSQLKINAAMGTDAILANFIHENLHHALPQASEEEVDLLTQQVAERLGR